MEDLENVTWGGKRFWQDGTEGWWVGVPMEYIYVYVSIHFCFWPSLILLLAHLSFSSLSLHITPLSPISMSFSTVSVGLSSSVSPLSLSLHLFINRMLWIFFLFHAYFSALEQRGDRNDNYFYKMINVSLLIRPYKCNFTCVVTADSGIPNPKMI